MCECVYVCVYITWVADLASTLLWSEEGHCQLSPIFSCGTYLYKYVLYWMICERFVCIQYILLPSFWSGMITQSTNILLEIKWLFIALSNRKMQTQHKWENAMYFIDLLWRYIWHLIIWEYSILFSKSDIWFDLELTMVRIRRVGNIVFFLWNWWTMYNYKLCLKKSIIKKLKHKYNMLSQAQLTPYYVQLRRVET